MGGDGLERDRVRHPVVRGYRDLDRVTVSGSLGADDPEEQLLLTLSGGLDRDLSGIAVVAPELLVRRIVEDDVPVGSALVGPGRDGERDLHVGSVRRYGEGPLRGASRVDLLDCTVS